MFIGKWAPVFEQDMETGVDDGSVGGDRVIPTPPPQPAEGPGSGRSKLRAELETNMRSANEAAEKVEKKEPTKKKGKAPISRARQEMAEEEPDDTLLAGDEGEVEAPIEGEEEEQALQAPAALSREAKAEWANTPPAVQAAFLKREKDMETGVAALKQNYADIDKALQPRLQTIRDQGHTPAEAVNQLFLWFEALTLDPQRIQAGQAPIALLALAHSFGIDLNNGQLIQQGEQQQSAAGQPDLGEIPDSVKQYIGGLEQKLNQLGGMVQGGFQNFQSTFQQQAMKETTSIMEQWAKGKPYFEEVRQQMAHIIGTRMIPPLPDGSADLDTAYDRAMYMNPVVRDKVLADRRKAALEKRKKAEEAEKAAQQAAADKARRAGGGVLRPSSPGATFANDDKAKKRGKSVRESLADAMEEIGGR
jgi:hypothetical protein